MKLLRANKTKTDCGIVAAYNAAQWFGIKCTYGKVLALAVSTGYNPKVGLYLPQFRKMLRILGVPVKKIRPKSPDAMVKKINQLNMLAVLYVPTGCTVGHALSCVLDCKGDPLIVNPEPGKYGDRRTWANFIVDAEVNGMKEFHVYEIPYRTVVRNDDSRTT